MNAKCRIVIAEDHHLLRSGLSSMLSGLGQYEVVGESKDGGQACRCAASLSPDLILMDLAMPGMNGIDAIATIKRRSPLIRIVALTVHNSEEYVREALRAGTDGYVLKDASFEDLLIAMQAVMLGRKHLSPDVYGDVVVKSFVEGRELPASKNSWERLTPRERRGLKLVAEGRTNREVGLYLNLSPKTIEKYRASLMHKLDISNLTGLVLAAIEMGLIASLAKKFYDPSPGAVVPAALRAREPSGTLIDVAVKPDSAISGADGA